MYGMRAAMGASCNSDFVCAGVAVGTTRCVLQQRANDDDRFDAAISVSGPERASHHGGIKSRSAGFTCPGRATTSEFHFKAAGMVCDYAQGQGMCSRGDGSMDSISPCGLSRSKLLRINLVPLIKPPFNSILFLSDQTTRQLVVSLLANQHQPPATGIWIDAGPTQELCACRFPPTTPAGGIWDGGGGGGAASSDGWIQLRAGPACIEVSGLALHFGLVSHGLCSLPPCWLLLPGRFRDARKGDDKRNAWARYGVACMWDDCCCCRYQQTVLCPGRRDCTGVAPLSRGYFKNGLREVDRQPSNGLELR